MPSTGHNPLDPGCTARVMGEPYRADAVCLICPGEPHPFGAKPTAERIIDPADVTIADIPEAGRCQRAVPHAPHYHRSDTDVLVRYPCDGEGGVARPIATDSRVFATDDSSGDEDEFEPYLREEARQRRREATAEVVDRVITASPIPRLTQWVVTRLLRRFAADLLHEPAKAMRMQERQWRRVERTAKREGEVHSERVAAVTADGLASAADYIEHVEQTLRAPRR